MRMLRRLVCETYAIFRDQLPGSLLWKFPDLIDEPDSTVDLANSALFSEYAVARRRAREAYPLMRRRPITPEPPFPVEDNIWPGVTPAAAAEGARKRAMLEHELKYSRWAREVVEYLVSYKS